MEYQIAMINANSLLKKIRPYCKKLEIVGDLRRHCPAVETIEILAISREVEMLDLFGEAVKPFQMINEWVSLCGLQFAKNGSKYKQFFWKGLWVNLYLTTEYQWGLHMAIRTGCTQFSKWLVTPKQKGGALPGYMQVKNGWVCSKDKKIVTLTEPNFFTTIDTEWIRPDLRTADIWKR